MFEKITIPGTTYDRAAHYALGDNKFARVVLVPQESKPDRFIVEAQAFEIDANGVLAPGPDGVASRPAPSTPSYDRRWETRPPCSPAGCAWWATITPPTWGGLRTGRHQSSAAQRYGQVLHHHHRQGVPLGHWGPGRDPTRLKPKKWPTSSHSKATLCRRWGCSAGMSRGPVRQPPGPTMLCRTGHSAIAAALLPCRASRLQT